MELQKIANNIMAKHFEIGDIVECLFDDELVGTKKGCTYIISGIEEITKNLWPKLALEGCVRRGHRMTSPCIEDFIKVS